MRHEAGRQKCMISDGGAALILWLAFAAGCAVGAVWASRISPAAAEELKTGQDASVQAAKAGTMQTGFWQSLRVLLPWTAAACILSAFVSCGVTLPLLFVGKGCLAAYTVSAVLAVRGLRLGAATAGAVCGVKNLLLLLALAAACTPNFARTIRRERRHANRRIYAADEIYGRSIWLSLLLTTAAAAADVYLTPALMALLNH